MSERDEMEQLWSEIQGMGELAHLEARKLYRSMMFEAQADPVTFFLASLAANAQIARQLKADGLLCGAVCELCHVETDKCILQ